MRYLILLLFVPIFASAQFHMGVGTMNEKQSIAWKVGYSEYVDWFGVNVAVRYTGYPGDTFYTLEHTVKAKTENNIHRIEFGFGTAYDFDRCHWHFVTTLRNSIKVEDGFWLNFDFDNTFRGETYLMLGISLKSTGKVKKKKRFY